jgi:hypothetical protein
MEQTAPLACQKEVGMRKMEFTIQTARALLCLIFRIVVQTLLTEITRQTMKRAKSSQFRNAQRILLKIDDQLLIL